MTHQACCRYLAEKHSGKFIPKDPSARARMSTWIFYQMVREIVAAHIALDLL